MSCEAAESAESAVLRMARVNSNNFVSLFWPEKNRAFQATGKCGMIAVNKFDPEDKGGAV